MTARQINKLVRTESSRCVYILEGGSTPHRITRARTVSGSMHVRILATGGWVPMSPRDTIEVR